jgi:ABC-type xylose transport system permease subunit
MVYTKNKNILEATPKRKFRLKSYFFCQNQGFNQVVLVLQTNFYILLFLETQTQFGRQQS